MSPFIIHVGVATIKHKRRLGLIQIVHHNLTIALMLCSHFGNAPVIFFRQVLAIAPVGIVLIHHSLAIAHVVATFVNHDFVISPVVLVLIPYVVAITPVVASLVPLLHYSVMDERNSGIQDLLCLCRLVAVQ